MSVLVPAPLRNVDSPDLLSEAFLDELFGARILESCPGFG